MATKTPIGIEIAAHTNPCNTVPTMAWYTPPPDMNAVMSACECVHHTVDLTVSKPLVITEYSTQVNGPSATTTDSVTKTVATTSEVRRRRLTPVKRRALRGRSRIDVIGPPYPKQLGEP